MLWSKTFLVLAQWVVMKSMLATWVPWGYWDQRKVPRRVEGRTEGSKKEGMTIVRQSGITQMLSAHADAHAHAHTKQGTEQVSRAHVSKYQSVRREKMIMR
ncbi:hypothetical protein BofuT4_P137450.1 [Botrytis cinerea T4]|uniref:Uncharacterized protein n=1 Tax=Botryotinia fuckeliana (strain T4) TaxID=999810 RepID=G2YQ02_BOTF4|nr:hypothetical protein BofuT4_P137450.1 [Botrytis cinerea T4]